MSGYKRPTKPSLGNTAAKSEGEFLRGRRSTPKKRAERGEPLTCYLPVGLGVKVRMKCALAERSVSDVISNLLTRWVNEK